MNDNSIFGSADTISEDEAYSIFMKEEMDFFLQKEYGDGQLEGFWWVASDDQMVVGCGPFGEYNSPGTWGTYYRFPNEENYISAIEYLESLPEYMDDSGE